MNGVTTSRHEYGHMTFPGTSYNMCNFSVEMSTFKQAKKLTFGCNKFGKRAVQNLPTRIYFQKKSRDEVDKITGKFHLSKVSPMYVSNHVKKLANNIY